MAVPNSGSANVSVLLNQLGCAGDLDGDGEIGLADLPILLAAYDSCGGDPCWDPVADLDDSGCVDLADQAKHLPAGHRPNGKSARPDRWSLPLNRGPHPKRGAKPCPLECVVHPPVPAEPAEPRIPGS